MTPQKKMPLGVELRIAVDLPRFLPYRVHRLAAGVSSPRSVKVKSGAVVRAREWRVLLVLAEFGPLTNVEIAQRAMMDSGATARAVKDLFAMGLVTARAHKIDRRKQVVTLTPKGAAAHDEIAPLRLAFSNELLAALTKQEREAFFRLLDKLDVRLTEMTRRDGDPFSED